MQRRRFKQLLSLNERLELEAARLRAQAERFAVRTKRDELIHKAHRADPATY